MIVESFVGGAVIVLAAIGTYSSFRIAQHRLTHWLKSRASDSPEPKISSIDPTPSFTVELVRTVLEHQAKREDQSRRELAFVVTQMASALQSTECSSGSPGQFIKPEKAVLPCTDSEEAKGGNGLVTRTVHRLRFWA